MTVLLTIATLVVGVVGVVYIPAVQNLKQDVGKIQGSMGSIDSRLDRFENRFDKIDVSLNSIQKATQGIETSIIAINARLADAESNPADILRVAGVSVSDWYFAAKVENKVYVFPRNKKAEHELVAAGLKATEIRPFLTGFEVEKVVPK